jgi:hypothetical protein
MPRKRAGCFGTPLFFGRRSAFETKRAGYRHLRGRTMQGKVTFVVAIIGRFGYILRRIRPDNFRVFSRILGEM